MVCWGVSCLPAPQSLSQCCIQWRRRASRCRRASPLQHNGDAYLDTCGAAITPSGTPPPLPHPSEAFLCSLSPSVRYPPSPPFSFPFLRHDLPHCQPFTFSAVTLNRSSHSHLRFLSPRLESKDLNYTTQYTFSFSQELKCFFDFYNVSTSFFYNFLERHFSGLYIFPLLSNFPGPASLSTKKKGCASNLAY